MRFKKAIARKSASNGVQLLGGGICSVSLLFRYSGSWPSFESILRWVTTHKPHLCNYNTKSVNASIRPLDDARLRFDLRTRETTRFSGLTIPGVKTK